MKKKILILPAFIIAMMLITCKPTVLQTSSTNILTIDSTYTIEKQIMPIVIDTSYKLRTMIPKNYIDDIEVIVLQHNGK
jgi:hypothetical protein